jgi:hypothetical protein
MADVGGEEIGGLRVGPYLPESGVEPTDGSPANAVTEFIPTVYDASAYDPTGYGSAAYDSAAYDASARDVMHGLYQADPYQADPPKVTQSPVSAYPAAEPQPWSTPQPAWPEQTSSWTEPTAASPTVQPEPVQPEPEQDWAVRIPARVTSRADRALARRAPALPGPPPAPPAPPPVQPMFGQPPLGQPLLGQPPAAAPVPAPALLPQPSAAHHLAAYPAAQPTPAPNPSGAEGFRTDEWLPVRRGKGVTLIGPGAEITQSLSASNPSNGPAASTPPALPAGPSSPNPAGHLPVPVPPTGSTLPAVAGRAPGQGIVKRSGRRGPVFIDADNWDFIPESDGPRGTTNETYAGRRRSVKPTARLALVLGVVLVGVAAATGVEIVLRSSNGHHSAAPDLRVSPSYPGDEGQVVASTPASGASATGRPGQPSTSVSGSASSSPTTHLIGNPSPPVSGSPSASASPSASVSGAAFSLTIEAEAAANVTTGSAARTTYPGTSGGQMVGYLGNVGEGAAGTLQVNGVTVPSSGTYTMTIFYVSSANRTAYISVNGSTPFAQVVTASNGCCSTVAVRVTLQAGANIITFSNPDARCPAIDKLVISQP